MCDIVCRTCADLIGTYSISFGQMRDFGVKPQERWLRLKLGAEPSVIPPVSLLPSERVACCFNICFEVLAIQDDLTAATFEVHSEYTSRAAQHTVHAAGFKVTLACCI